MVSIYTRLVAIAVQFAALMIVMILVEVVFPSSAFIETLFESNVFKAVAFVAFWLTSPILARLIGHEEA
jgi:hypothetical protein